jgi:flagellar biogenesis protein FliO
MIRRVRQGGSGRTSSSEMKVLETLHLAPRCALQLIQVDAQRFLVARDAHGLRSVTAVNSFAETLEALEAEPKDASTRELSTASTFGLSLENQPTSDRLTLSFAGRRNDPWQGH